MIALLTRRTLGDRPRRTALLLLGFGIAVGVMVTLLSIGSAVLEQARDKDLVGGGDVVVLPQGVDVEVLKVGGATGMFFAIDAARFIYRQVLSGPRFAPRLAAVRAPAWRGEPNPPPLAAASPLLTGKVVYLRRHGTRAAPLHALATGVIPSLDRAVADPSAHPRTGTSTPQPGAPATAFAWRDSRADSMWMEPPVDSLYDDLDHFHRPPPGAHDLDRWAEWLYFNCTEPASGQYAFLSFIVAGDWPAGKGRALPLLQIVRPGEPPARFGADLPLATDAVATDRVDVRLTPGTRAWFEGGAWRLRLDYDTPRGHVSGALDVEPLRDLYQPPFVIHDNPQFVSGYVVAAVRARANGWIQAGPMRLELRDAPAYHDHNWGTWRDVHWDWGTASSERYGLFYGRVEHPELRPGRSGAGLFAIVAEARSPTHRGGFWALFRPETIVYEWNMTPPPLPGAPVRIPQALELRGDSLDIRAQVSDVLATPPRAPGDSLVFLQARALFQVRTNVGGQSLAFEAPGFAETFVPGTPALKR